MATAPPQTAQQARTTFRVLLVEDNPGDARLLEEYLRERDTPFDLRWEQTLTAALDALNDHDPAVIVLDLGLPDSEGTGAVRRCRDAAPSVPVVVLTGQKNLETALAAQKAGAAEYLHKDELTPSLVERTLRWAHERVQMQEEIERRESRFQGLAHSIPGVIFQFVVGEDGEYGFSLVGDQAEQLLGISAAPDDFFERALRRVPPSHRAALMGSIAEAVEAETTWRFEAPFEKPSGETVWVLGTSSPVRRGADLVFNGVLLDITERKEEEQKRRVLSEAVEQTNEAVLVTDAEPQGSPGPRIVYVNSAFEAMTGYDESEVLGHSPRILQGPDTEQHVLEDLREALEAGEPWEGETVNYRKDGTPYTVRWNVAPVRDEEGAIEYWVSVQRDVTEQRQRESDLRHQRNLLEQTQRLAGAWEVDRVTDELAWTEEVYRIHEVSPGTEITVEEALEFYPSAVRSRVQDAFRRCIEHGEEYDIEVPLVTAKGNRRWVRAVGAPVEERDGTYRKIAGAFQDITERKRRQRVLEKRQQNIEALYAATAQLLRAENKSEVGQAVIGLLGGTLAYPGVSVRFAQDGHLVPAHLSSQMASIMPESPVLDVQGPSFIAEAYREDKTIALDDVKRLDDPTDYGDTRAAVAVPIGAHGVIKVIDREVGGIDAFDRRLIEILAAHATAVLDGLDQLEGLREAKEEAERMNRLKSAFLANMSHEIRTPLTSILGFAEVIGEEVDESHDDDVGRLARLIAKSGHRLMETLEGVLNLSKLEAGAMDFSCGPVDLLAEAEEMVEQSHPQAETAGVSLHVATPDSPVRAWADEGGVRIVLRNLISNAIKYTEEGGQVWVRVRADGSDAVVEVEDTGIGMDPDDVPALFESFTQASEGIGREYEGTGLGLAVTKKALEQMGGSIEVETAPGEGSCFTVRLPRSKEDSGRKG